MVAQCRKERSHRQGECGALTTSIIIIAPIVRGANPRPLLDFSVFDFRFRKSAGWLLPESGRALGFRQNHHVHQLRRFQQTVIPQHSTELGSSRCSLLADGRHSPYPLRDLGAARSAFVVVSRHHDRCCARHRRLGFQRRRGNPGGPQDLRTESSTAAPLSAAVLGSIGGNDSARFGLSSRTPIVSRHFLNFRV
jgi:hypothetical protein